MNINIPDELIQELKKECKYWGVPHSQEDLERMISSEVEELIKKVYKEWKGYNTKQQGLNSKNYL